MAGELESALASQLESLAAEGLRRGLRLIESAQGAYVTVGGRRLCCMCSNNYLGLAGHPEVIAAVQRAVEVWGWGAGASRLVSGHMGPHSDADDVVLLDKLNHHSIIDAVRGSGATLRVFPHRDYRKLERLLAGSGEYRRRVVVTDSVFSMDGDLADLPRLVELKRRYEAILIVDEAHATGVFGAYGRGLAEQMGVEDGVDVSVCAGQYRRCVHLHDGTAAGCMRGWLYRPGPRRAGTRSA
jgi:7-keto-8-aminopelargonate synthetase-like enzyme